MLADIVFLERFPGFSYADLQATPDDIVAGLRFLALKRAQHDAANS